MINALQRYGVTRLWHFTDAKNVKSIRDNNGLLSWAESARRGMTIPAPGGNDWSHDADRLFSVDGYVHLAFVKNHPMLYVARQDGRIENPVWVEIDVSVLAVAGVMYTNDVSNKSGVPLLNPDEARDSVDLEVLYTYMNWRDDDVMRRRRNAEKSEVLVPVMVPIHYIKGFHNG
ncbi:ssDNA thymidine ADP-ribosyltransferase, DarT [compost metagenome]